MICPHKTDCLKRHATDAAAVTPVDVHRLIRDLENTSTATKVSASLCWLATLTTAQINNISDPDGSLMCINLFIYRPMFSFVNCVTRSRVQSILNLPWWRSVPRTVLETLGQSRRMRKQIGTRKTVQAQGVHTHRMCAGFNSWMTTRTGRAVKASSASPCLRLFYY